MGEEFDCHENPSQVEAKTIGREQVATWGSSKRIGVGFKTSR